jgi:hypothetical protein
LAARHQIFVAVEKSAKAPVSVRAIQVNDSLLGGFSANIVLNFLE